MLAHPDHPHSIGSVERTLRIMAAEDRDTRRSLGKVFLSAIRTADLKKQDRHASMAKPTRRWGVPDVAHVFSLQTYPTGFELLGGYDDYRKTRSRSLETYCCCVLLDHQSRKRAVGVGFETQGKNDSLRAYAPDMCSAEVLEWNPELIEIVEESGRGTACLLRATSSPRGVSFKSPIESAVTRTFVATKDHKPSGTHHRTFQSGLAEVTAWGQRVRRKWVRPGKFQRVNDLYGTSMPGSP